MSTPSSSPSPMHIDIIYALPDRYEQISLSLETGATVADAIAASGITRKYPDLDINGRNKIGIFARLVKPDTVLRDKDRIEIYRPLIADPKTVRRQRAAEGKTMKKGGGTTEAE